MPTIAPFKYDLQLYPTKTFRTRWEQIRERERWAAQIQEALVGMLSVDPQSPTAGVIADSSINIAQPGGGASLTYDRFGWTYGGVATKPAFGRYPAQATIIGFYDPMSVDDPGGTDTGLPDLVGNIAALQQTSADTTVFCCNAVQTGPMGQTPWANGPSASVDAEVLALKNNIEAALTAYMPSSFKFTTWRIEVRGVIYGFSGYTFPLPT